MQAAKDSRPRRGMPGSANAAVAAAAGAATAPQHTQAADAIPTAPVETRTIAMVDFSSSVALLAACHSAAEMRALAVSWREQEAQVRTPLVLLQVLALTGEYAANHPPPTNARKLPTYGQQMKAHGQLGG